MAELAPRIWQVIDNAPVVTAVTHKDADGDTLGSALALALALEPIGKTVPVVSSPPVPGAWWFLPGIERVNRQAPPANTPVFIFDASDASRAGAYESLVRQATIVVNIDHHVSNARFGTINLVLTEAASTGELVYDLLKAWKVDISPGAASCLYATILSDTGGFRHDNTSAHALRAAAELVQLGADPVVIARGLFKSRPASSLRMQGRILQGLHFEFGDRRSTDAAPVEHILAAALRMPKNLVSLCLAWKNELAYRERRRDASGLAPGFGRRLHRGNVR